MTYAIETIKLVKRYPLTRSYRDLFVHPLQRKATTALEDVTIQVKRGELFSLLGPNGAGKTTLLKILSTLVLPTEGKAYVNGYDVTTQDKKIREIIGYVVSEERSFYWRLTGLQNLKFFATLYNLSPSQAAKRIKEVLDLVGLEREAGKRFKDYATGMRQRLAFARALLNDPQILLMDEPTKSLDPTAARHIQEFIKNTLVGEGKRTVLFATHNLHEAEDLSDRIAIIDRAKVKACGTLQEIRHVLTTDGSYRLFLREPTGDTVERLLAIDGIQNVAIVRRDRVSSSAIFRVETDGTDGCISKVIETIVRSGGEVFECIPEKTSLSEIFDRVTKEGD